mgnify:FL=1
MTERLADFIVHKLCRKGLIREDEKRIYKVGFDVMIGTLANSSVILAVGFFLRDAGGAALFLLCFCTVRNYCGGYHAKTRMKCLMVMVAAFCFVSLMSEMVAGSFGILLYGYVGISIALGCALLWFVPVTDITKKYTPDDEAGNRRKALRILLIWYSAMCMGIAWDSAVAVKITMTMNVIAWMVLAAKPWRTAGIGKCR